MKDNKITDQKLNQKAPLIADKHELKFNQLRSKLELSRNDLCTIQILLKEIASNTENAIVADASKAGAAQLKAIIDYLYAEV